MKKQNFCEGWRCNGNAVIIPHDAMQEAGRDPQAKSGSGGAYFRGGVYTYEKAFTRPSAEHAELLFEGIYRDAKVYVNGQLACEHAYGYTPFTVDLDAFLTDGTNNVTVIADNTRQPNSRWYTGSGIYRPVWLLTGGPLRIEKVSIRTEDHAARKVNVRVKANGGTARVTLLDGDKVLVRGDAGEFSLPEAELWSDANPKLYRCRVELIAEDAVVDKWEQLFGIRSLQWDGKGLYVNGQRTLLRGGCIHHDNGILGARAFPEAEWRKVRLLKEAGFNAVRCAHNPCSEALLEACDVYGLYVVDESWDMWFQRKTKYDYALDFMANWQDDLSAMVEKDRSHPCVIAYSIGNELSEPAKPEGQALAVKMVSFLHQLDPTRPVTAGINLMLLYRAFAGSVQYSEADPNTEPMNSSLMFNKMAAMIGTGMNNSSASDKVDAKVSPLLDALDIAGYNYASGRYKIDETLHPDRLILGSETFPQDIVKNWRMVEAQSNLAGDFMWTAIDYLGEAGIGAWAYTKDGRCFSKPYPWLLGDVGVLDLLGDPNGELFLTQYAWHQLKAPQIAVRPANHPGVKVAKQTWRGTNSLPSWSWHGCEGNKTIVEVYTEAPFAVLYLNRRKIGKKRTKDGVATFEVRYEPGCLKAFGVNDEGQAQGCCSLQSAQSATPRLHGPVKAAQGEVIFLPVCIEDAQGIVESNADCMLSLKVTGGELLAFGSANPRTEESFLTGCYTTYYGRALAAVRCGESNCVQVELQYNSKTCDTLCIPICQTPHTQGKEA